MNLDYAWRKIRSPPVLFVLLATLWGGSFVAIDVGVREWPPILFAAVRYDIAGALVLLLAVASGTRWTPTRRSDVAAVGVVATFVVFGHHALLYVGQETVPGPVASALVALAPVVTAVLAPAFVGDEGLGRSGLAGVFFGFLGVVIMTLPGSDGGVDPVGAALVFAATVSFAVGTLLLRRVDTSLGTVGLQGWGMLCGAALLHVTSLVVGESQTASTSPTGLATLAFLVLGPGVVAFFLYFRLLATVGATRTALVGYVEPLAATGIAFVLFGYLPSTAAVVGFVLVIVGFAMVEGHAVVGAVDDVLGRVRTTFA